MFRTKYLRLTKDQKERDVIFSSCLIVTNNPDIETTVHEVFRTQKDRWEVIDRLKDVTFFKSMARDFGYDVIHEIRS